MHVIEERIVAVTESGGHDPPCPVLRRPPLFVVCPRLRDQESSTGVPGPLDLSLLI